MTLAYSSENEFIEEYNSTGSDRAATAFVRSYQNFVFSTALRYIKNYDDADDIAQEVFIKALNSLSRFEGKSSVKTWLYRITVNICHNYSRRKSLLSFIPWVKNSNDENDDNTEIEISSNELTPDAVFEANELEEIFIKSLGKLPEKQRETFALRYFEELPYEEISELLGTSVGGLKANYFQAVKKLSVLLKPAIGVR